jgi:hypothetical protein
VTDPTFTEFEEGEREALLQVRSFIAKHGTKEVDAYCAQRLHDIRMDARHRDQQLQQRFERSTGELVMRPGGLNFAPPKQEQGQARAGEQK